MVSGISFENGRFVVDHTKAPLFPVDSNGCFVLALTKVELEEFGLKHGNQDAAVASAMHELFIAASMLFSDRAKFRECAIQVRTNGMTFDEFTEKMSIELQCFILAMVYRVKTSASNQTVSQWLPLCVTPKQVCLNVEGITGAVVRDWSSSSWTFSAATHWVYWSN